jgi:hypothetical protein
MNSALNPSLRSTLEALTPEEKWQAFQFLWQEVAEDHADEIEPPQWHDEILKERGQKIEDCRAEWLDFDQAMDELKAGFVRK